MIHFLTHPHHRYTQSFDWLKTAIGQEVRMLYGDVATLQEYLPSLSHSAPRLLVLFQLDYLAAWCSQFTKVLCMPMYDLTRMSPDNYLSSLRQVEWICFSRTLHQRLSGLGLSSRYLQYAPDPSGFQEVGWEHGPSGYFWERMPQELDSQAASQLVSGLPVRRLEVRKMGDSLFGVTNSGDAKKGAEQLWQSHSAYLENLRQFNIYVAPRRVEGIGMTFIEAMAMGMCVVAENQPTANEYITGGVDGILYGGDEKRLFMPSQRSHAEFQRIGQRARKTIQTIHEKWEIEKGAIRQTIDRLIQTAWKQESEPSALLLQATLEFEQRPETFWKMFVKPNGSIWRSSTIECRARRDASLFGWVCSLLRNPRRALLALLDKSS